MSRFFESIDEEREESSRVKIKEKTYEASEKQGKKEKRLHDLQCRVMELEEEENQKIFDKQLKKILVDIRKMEGYLSRGLPPFLKKFLESPRVYTKTHKKTIDELLAHHEPKEDENGQQEDRRDEERLSRDLSKILVIKDTEERRKELEEFKDSAKDKEMKAKALRTLLSIHMKSKDGVEIMKTINELLDCFGDREKNTLLENIDFYLETLYEILDSPKISTYNGLLKRLLEIDPKLVERRVLQFEFFKLGRPAKTEDRLFRLLYIDRTQGYGESRKYYESIKDTIGEGKIEQEVLGEFGLSSFRSGDFETSFEVLSKCSEVQPPNHGLVMKLLCVILNDRIRGSPVHKKFLEDFKSFGKNRFCLPSGDSAFEVYRSFYLLNMLDKKGAGEIVKRFCEGFEESIWFKDFVESRIKG
ncbi:uncharacterized protein Eint_100910 [Encephalitozoon intestinalis ATCC 50506]|uniref:Uncharacterized protein n=1 Tax=Encephalitozoon intestinalis (strain ATCC 50506) TaxID=876142 RepID=E0S9N2_ENCIT|nr:uncharacterized protein Eint_100910 [Encephalitozoon intestinalis ATCC 50506]ADM12417.1 hypothetical protein Eint_100910 [Encephalitozoon intestinalis ATCC 50506]UTX46251.1 hypothetical protein GPK93_10g18490 [Encephalitozoon intestinalis]